MSRSLIAKAKSTSGNCCTYDVVPKFLHILIKIQVHVHVIGFLSFASVWPLSLTQVARTNHETVKLKERVDQAEDEFHSTRRHEMELADSAAQVSLTFAYDT